MFKNKMFICMVLVFALSMMLFQGLALAQLKCLFVSKPNPTVPDPRDSSLVDFLEGNYIVDFVGHPDVQSGAYTVDQMKDYDFVFISESVGSGSGAPLLGAPVPIVTTEMYFTKQTVFGWAPDNNQTGTYYGGTKSGKVTIVDGDHQLAADLVTGSEVDLVTNTIKNDYLTFSVPGVDVIQIATLTADPTQTIVMGVDSGTVLYNAPGVKDGSLVSENKVAAIGIHADGNEFITDEGFQLIQAGIDWVLGIEPPGPTEDWQNQQIGPLSGVYVAEFNARSTADSIDGCIGLSKDPADGYGDMSCIVQFSNQGVFKVRDGNGYDAINDLAYEADATYGIKMLVNMIEATYSVWVTPPVLAKTNNGGPVQIAKDFAFRPNDADPIKEFTNLAVKLSFDAKWGGNEGRLIISDFGSQSPEDWINTPIAQQTGAFVAEFNATPTADKIDGVLGLSNIEPTGYGDLNILLLFNNSGFITAKNGGSYEAINDLPYTANTAYAFKQTVNIPAQTYDLSVTPEGGTELLIADDFAFSKEGDTLNYRSVKMSIGGKWGGADGVVLITDFTIKNPDDFINVPIEPQTGRFMAEFNAKATADSVDGVLGLSDIIPTGYSDLSILLLFNNSGFITAKNGGSYEAINDLPYTANTTYAFKQVVDIPNQTYSLWVTPQNGGAAKQAGAEVLLAEDFAFSKETDTLNYRVVKMSIGGKWGGADGIVEVTDFTITDAPLAKKSCLFVSSGPAPGASVDSMLILHLAETYDLTVVDDDSVEAGVVTNDDLIAHDFGFISESVGSGKIDRAVVNFGKTCPVPMFYTELYCTKPGITGWGSAEGFWGSITDSTGDGRKVIIIDDTSPLSAGFALNTEVEIVSGTDNEELNVLTYGVPEVDYIPIAVSAVDPMLSVVFGVEAGTALYDDLGLVIDPSVVTENRAAAVGIYAAANNYITADGYKLMDTAIQWILGEEPNDVDEDANIAVQPVKFGLAQNYPNPFNPVTTISFSLAKPGHTTLTVYNVVGQVVATPVDNVMSVGHHNISFNAYNIPSGMYFYKIRSGEFTKVKKMMLMK
jgi:hypothetical protein